MAKRMESADRWRYERPDWADEFEAAGNRITPEGMVVLYHATTAAKARKILEEGVLRRPKHAPDSYGVYFSSSPEVAADYGDGTLVQVLVPVEDLHLDDVFPSGRMDFYAKTHGGIYVPLQLEIVPAGAERLKNSFMYAQEYHEHPMHGWVSPDGDLHYTTNHYEWALSYLSGLADAGAIEDEYDASEHLFNNGWIRLGPGCLQANVDMLNRKQLRTVQDLVMDMEPDEEFYMSFEGAKLEGGGYVLAPTILKARSWKQLARKVIG